MTVDREDRWREIYNAAQRQMYGDKPEARELSDIALVMYHAHALAAAGDETRSEQ